VEIKKALPDLLAEAAEVAGGSLPEATSAPANVNPLTLSELWEQVTQAKASFEEAKWVTP
jgi:hypothetical protein